jgi:regulator of sirC expression with transglutaminase-like and TPR domain
MSLDRTLQLLAKDSSAPVDLAEVALQLAVDEYPELDLPVYLARFDDLAATLAPRVLAAPSLQQRVSELSYGLFVEAGFEGNSSSYYDPRNSYLNEVLDRQLGIPLTLTLLAMAVGERCGMTIFGVGLPGHFVARAEEYGQSQLFDPFNSGQLLDEESCSALIANVTGQPFAATEEALQPSPPGAIVQRMLNNLKAIYLRQLDYPRAARVIRRLTQLTPQDAFQFRDLGIAHYHAHQPGPAIDALEMTLALAPQVEEAEAIRNLLKAARKQVAQWN